MIGKWLRRFGMILLFLPIVYVVYLVAGNLFLRFGLRPLLNGDPEKSLIEYESAYTLWLGKVHVRGFRMRKAALGSQWALELEQGVVTVDLVDLRHKIFHVRRVRAESVSFRLRRTMDVEGAASPRAAALPPIGGFDDPPMKPVGPPIEPVSDANYNLWIVNIENIDADVREVWIDEWRIVGPSRVAGGFYLKPERTVLITPTTLDVHSSELRIGEQPALTSLDAHVVMLVEAIDLRGPLEQRLHQISSLARIDGQIPNADFVRMYLGKAAPIHVEDGSGALHLELHLGHGVMRPGTVVDVASDHAVIGTAEIEFTTAFTAEARVNAGPAGPYATGELRIAKSTITSPGRKGSPPVIEHAVARFSGLPRDIAGPYAIEHTELDVPGRFPDLAWVLPPVKASEPRQVTLAGAARVHAHVDLDRRFRAAGVVDAHSDRVEVKAPKITMGARIEANVGFDGAELPTKSVVFRPSFVLAEQLEVTRQRRAHKGGTARVDVTAARIEEGHPLGFALTTTANLPDVSWLAFRAPTKGNPGGMVRAAKVVATLHAARPDLLMNGTPAQAAITGNFSVSTVGDGYYEDVTWRGKVAAKGVIEGLDLGRRALHLRRVSVTARDIAIYQGTEHTRGWWGDFNVSQLNGRIAKTVDLDMHVDSHCKDGAPFIAALEGAGTLPRWVGSVFPGTGLRASTNMRRANDLIDLGLAVRSTSANVTADLHHLGGAIDGPVLVETRLVKLGIEFTHGKSHVKVFAGNEWLQKRINAVESEQAMPGVSSTAQR